MYSSIALRFKDMATEVVYFVVSARWSFESGSRSTFKIMLGQLTSTGFMHVQWNVGKIFTIFSDMLLLLYILWWQHTTHPSKQNPLGGLKPSETLRSASTAGLTRSFEVSACLQAEAIRFFSVSRKSIPSNYQTQFKDRQCRILKLINLVIHGEKLWASRYAFDRKLNGPHNLSECGVYDANLCPYRRELKKMK
jgi:hypothetical protein